MSAISQKSISGITSITSPAGTDDQISLHTSNTNEALKIDGAGNLHLNNHVNTTGVTTASNFKTGSSNLHSTGLTVGDTFVHSTGVNGSSADIDDFVSVGNNIHLGNAGVVTATSFIGDGSDLTNLPAGLGTALSATASSPLNKMYYTNQVLGVPSSVTVDVPASASKAYTQYADIKVDGSADLIIAEGDDLIPDVLGLADFGTFGGGASAGRIRVNSISNAANDGSPTVQKGLVITGVCTATSFSGSGANLTSLPAANLTGTLPAISGANLTSLPAANLTGTLPAISGANLTSLPSQLTLSNNADNRIITGGSGTNLNGEANLTFDGSTLTVSSGTSGDAKLIIEADTDNNEEGDNPTLVFKQDGGIEVSSIGHGLLSGDQNGLVLANSCSNGYMSFATGSTNGHTNATERLRIKSDGSTFLQTSNVNINRGTSGAGYPLTVRGPSSGDVIRLERANSYQWHFGFDSNSAFYAKADTSERFRIDSSGNVTKPNSSCFQAVRNGSHVSAGSYIVFSSVDLNKGNDYNSSNGIFTAPVAGTYLFHISSIAFNNATTVFRFFLRINNGNTGSGNDAHLRLDLNNDDTDYAPNASYTYYVYMNANDTARVFFQPDNNSASVHGGSDYLKFGGHLVG